MSGDLELSFSTEPVTGWRVWRVCREVDTARSARELAQRLLEAELQGIERPVAAAFSHRLRSLTEQEFWPARARLGAACTLCDGPAPAPSCQCGVWAFRDAARAEAVALAYQHGPTAVALGRVWLWGRVIEHEDGWRAQYGYPRDLTVFGSDPVAAEDVRAAYGVDVAFTPLAELRAA